MKLPRRQFLHLAACAAALPAVSPIAWAQAYPTRRVRVVVPFGTGGPTDVFARLLTRKLSERLGQQFYVENIPGDFVPWRFSAAGRISAWKVLRRRRLKICTAADSLCLAPRVGIQCRPSW